MLGSRHIRSFSHACDRITFWTSLIQEYVVLGFTVVLAVRSLGKIAFCPIVSNIYNLIGLKSVIRGRSKDRYFNTTYNKSFKLPPVLNAVSRKCFRKLQVRHFAYFVYFSTISPCGCIYRSYRGSYSTWCSGNLQVKVKLQFV